MVSLNSSGPVTQDDDCSLIEKAKNGDDPAFAALVRKYRPLLDAAVAQYRGELSAADLEDLGQEALVAFHRAVVTYNVGYGRASFGLYARTCVNRALVSAIRKLTRGIGSETVLSLDDESLADLPASGPAPGDEIIARESAAELVRRIRSALSGYENTVWWLHVSGKTIAEIAGATGKSPKSVGNALARIRVKLRALLS